MMPGKSSDDQAGRQARQGLGQGRQAGRD